jgi:hypothetical protein
MTMADAAELEFWRHFATKLVPGSDLPRVGAPLVGRQFVVIERGAGAAGRLRWDLVLAAAGLEQR